MTVSELLLRCLENEGVKYVFGLPGEENIEFLHKLRNSGISFVTTRDERGASFMANAWGRLSRPSPKTPGVCLSTLGPGAINMIPGVADAYLDFAPVVAITAQKGQAETYKEAHQYIDILSTYKPITKWSASIRGKNVQELVRKAFRVALAEKPGPVHLELAEDVACLKTEGKPMRPAPSYYPGAAAGEIKKALALIKRSSNPIVIAGNGVIRAGASRELALFARKLRLPVACTFMAMGALDSREELFISTVGLQTRDYISCGLERADLIIAVGYDPVEFSPRYWKGPQTRQAKPVIHISPVPAEVDISYNLLELSGDIGKTLVALAQKADFKRARPEYFLGLKRLSDEAFSSAPDPARRPLKPLAVIRELRAAMGGHDLLISDVGAHKIWIARFFKAHAPETVLMSNGLSSMGFALPAAIAARLARPERNVVAAVGDGGFLMSAAELETAGRLGLSFTVLVFNDSGYGLIEWKERLRYKEEFFTRFGNPDFVKLAGAFGARGLRVESERELAPALKEALGGRGITIIDCPVDYRENLNLTRKLGSLICPM